MARRREPGDYVVRRYAGPYGCVLYSVERELPSCNTHILEYHLYNRWAARAVAAAANARRKAKAKRRRG